MNNSIVIKNIPPIKVLTTCEEIPFSDLEKEARLLFKVSEPVRCGSLTNLIHKANLTAEFKEEAQVFPCVPIRNPHITIDENKYKFMVLNRATVISITHKNDYDKLDKPFNELMVYMAENNLKIQLPLRVIHHKKRV